MIDSKGFLKIETKLLNSEQIEMWKFVSEQIKKEAILNNNLSKKEITERSHITQAEYLRMMIKKLFLIYKDENSKVLGELIKIQESIVLDKLKYEEKNAKI